MDQTRKHTLPRHETELVRRQSSSPELSLLGYIFSRQVFRKNLIVALLVGALLSLINQFDVLLKGHLTAALVGKIALNFLIPLAVSSLSAALNRHCD